MGRTGVEPPCGHTASVKLSDIRATVLQPVCTTSAYAPAGGLLKADNLVGVGCKSNHVVLPDIRATVLKPVWRPAEGRGVRGGPSVVQLGKMAVGHAGWVETFNASPDEGIQKLLSQLPSPDAEHVSQLLDEEVESGAVDRHKLSEYLSLAEPGDEGVHYSIGVALMARLCQRVGSERSEEPGRRFALSLRSGLQSVPLPANLRSARVILRMWAEGFHALHPDVLSGPDVVHAMAFSAVRPAVPYTPADCSVRRLDSSRFFRQTSDVSPDARS